MKRFVAALPLVVSVCVLGCSKEEDDTGSGSSNFTQCDPNAQPPAAVPGTVMFNPADKDALQPVDAIEGTSLLGKLFETFLVDFEKCASDLDNLDDARAKGQFVPSIVGKISGSFTAAKKQQTLYYVSINECNASHADNFGTGLIVVIENGNVVLRNPVEGGGSIHRLVDLDGDGRNEVVIKFGFMGQGVTEVSARLVRLRPEGLAVVKDFGSVLSDACDTGRPDATKEFTIVRAVPKAGATLPDFKEEKHNEKCPPDGAQ